MGADELYQRKSEGPSRGVDPRRGSDAVIVIQRNVFLQRLYLSSLIFFIVIGTIGFFGNTTMVVRDSWLASKFSKEFQLAMDKIEAGANWEQLRFAEKNSIKKKLDLRNENCPQQVPSDSELANLASNKYKDLFWSSSNAAHGPLVGFLGGLIWLVPIPLVLLVRKWLHWLIR